VIKRTTQVGNFSLFALGPSPHERLLRTTVLFCAFLARPDHVTPSRGTWPFTESGWGTLMGRGREQR
jgi:hypothetical protein